ncbi:MAG: ATP-binding protein [Thermodesulfobacteriota bacterium]
MMRESTRWMLKKHGWRIDRFIHNYVYFVFYYPYVKTVGILLPLVDHVRWFKPLAVLGRMVFSRYHSKVLSFGDAKQIFSLNQDIRYVAEANKQIIPFKYATKIIFQEPRHIAIMDCPCKKATNTCEPVKSCIAVGKQLATFWLDHCQKYHAERITQEEALEVIRRFRQQGHVTQAFFKVATGGSTGVICNCCPDCCVSLKATRYTRKIDSRLAMNAPSGYSIRHDAGKCDLCGTCREVCHFAAIDIADGVRRYDPSECMGCELCVEQCPRNALELFVDPKKPLPLDLDRIQRTYE